MSDYITRSAAVAVLHYNCDEKCSTVVPDMENIPSEDVAPVVHGYRVSTKKHKWKRDSNGNIDFAAWDSGYCNGPLCVECGEHFCIHCVGDEEVIKSKLESEDCYERYVCSLCGRDVPDDAPYCNCGAKMESEEGV